MNRLQLNGSLLERGVLRYTPAGVPIVEGLLLHQSEQMEASQNRRVECEVKVLGAGPIALTLLSCPLNSMLNCEGFLARKTRHSKSLQYHITALTISEICERNQHGVHEKT